MKILTSRNGIALIGVLTILLVLTLLLPAMFTMSDTATKFAVEGTDRQRASYFARSLCEMAVGTFNSTYSVENPAAGSVPDAFQKEYTRLLDWCMEEGHHGKPSDPIQFQQVSMYIGDDEKVYYSNQSDGGTDPSKLVTTTDMEFVGTGSCKMTFIYYEMDLLINLTTGEHWEIKNKQDYEDLYDVIKVCKADQVLSKNTTTGAEPTNEVKIIMRRVMGLDANAEIPADQQFTVSAVKNKMINFDAEANVKGKKETRQCVIILPTYPAQQNWLLYQGVDVGLSNEVFINPQAATGLTQINYNAQGVDDKYIPQNLLTFSCLGNMRISTEELKEGKYEWKTDQYVTKYVHKDEPFPKAENLTTDPALARPAQLPDGATTLVFDVSPGINTTPNGDPTAAILDGVNTAAYYNRTQSDNFIAFTASNSITMELPIMLLVNPTRANRLGDGLDKNHSIYKMVLFQAPTIVFQGQVDMLVSLYERPGNTDARRMSSVVLSAPVTSNHTYTNMGRVNPETGKKGVLVRAGKVFFYEDCYLWIINYADNGSGYSEHWYEVAQTVYFRDKDFTKIKVASAGDVYYFNAEVEMDGKPIGFSLAGYAIETNYLPNYQKYTIETTPWWRVWTKTQQALFGAYLDIKYDLSDTDNKAKTTYVKEDFYKVGNIYEGIGNPEELIVPDSDGLYTIWSS